MSYCTLSDLKAAISEAKLVQFTDDENLGSINVARITQAIASADTLIESYLRGKHQVPLTTALDRMRQLSIDFTIFFLYKRRREFDMPQSVDDDYMRNVSYLKSIAKGEILLDTPTDIPNTGLIIQTNKDSSSRVFTSDILGGF